MPYDRSIVRQETGYWCGPASAQVVLNSRGIHVDESDLAREMGTTWNGTDFIGQIERVLDARVPDARYTSVQMPNDPPTAEQRARLWRDIVRSIDAGWGVIVNIVAPPSNYPRAVAPSTISPAYSGGTVYHYMTVMGYDDEQRSVWIADSGFNPFGYWLDFDQLATLIPPKGTATPTSSLPRLPRLRRRRAGWTSTRSRRRWVERSRVSGTPRCCRRSPRRCGRPAAPRSSARPCGARSSATNRSG
ncbi:hypothetical protein GS909_07160 [Rhodococcus hoagii]|nr:hypothetical protein [Prescottella equi]